MPTRRSYRDACPIARALDVVGERWALLVVRELLLGPQRFSDLRRALPGASTNILSDRLRELGAHGVVSRHKLPPPAASTVYGLTARGQRLAPVLEALGDWGADEPVPSDRPSVSATSVMLFLRGCLRAHGDSPRGVYRVQLGDRVWTVRSDADEPTVESGEPDSPRAGVRTDPGTLNALLGEHVTLDAELAAGTVEVSGDVSSLRRLLRVAC